MSRSELASGKHVHHFVRSSGDEKADVSFAAEDATVIVVNVELPNNHYCREYGGF